MGEVIYSVVAIRVFFVAPLIRGLKLVVDTVVVVPFVDEKVFFVAPLIRGLKPSLCLCDTDV